jgi:hypothetical protein
MSRSSKNPPRPSTTTPLGLQPGRGPAAPKVATKVTDNAQGWAKVANIPVPPASEARNFNKPIGLGPMLVNGVAGSVPPVPGQKVPSSEETVKPKAGEGGFAPSPAPFFNTPAAPQRKTTTVEIDWYGAKLSLKCLSAVLQDGDPDRGGQKWLMLEMPLDGQTGNPPWLPPVAQAGEDGRISPPEFTCVVDSKRARCQILNIDLFDRVENRYIAIFRVLN